MAKKVDSFQQKISRNDRFAQMSQQEKIIEQKKKEILAKLEAKELAVKAEKTTKSTTDSSKSASKKYVLLNPKFACNSFNFNFIVKIFIAGKSQPFIKPIRLCKVLYIHIEMFMLISDNKW